MSAAPKDPELEYSPLCQTVTDDDITVYLHIYRLAGRDDGWSMEVVDRQGASTVWNDLFPTDEEAFSEFLSTVAAEGIEAFLVPTARVLH